MSYEIEFVIPFEILFEKNFADTWEPQDAVFSHEMQELLQVLNISIDSRGLAQEYCLLKHGQGDIHVFFDAQRQSFVKLDLYFGETDQHNMIAFGVHVPLHKKNQMQESLRSLYECAKDAPRSAWKELEQGTLLKEIDCAQYPKEIRESEEYMQKIQYHISFDFAIAVFSRSI